MRNTKRRTLLVSDSGRDNVNERERAPPQPRLKQMVRAAVDLPAQT
jgi:hypothetical protein